MQLMFLWDGRHSDHGELTLFHSHLELYAFRTFFSSISHEVDFEDGSITLGRRARKGGLYRQERSLLFFGPFV